MNKSKMWGIGIAVVVVALLGFMWYQSRPASPYGDLDDFAQCLTDRGVVMYGAYWCPHCQNQKKMFGSAFKNINYVECTEEAETCRANGIEGYPTYLFADGSRASGEQTLEFFAGKTGCELPRAEQRPT